MATALESLLAGLRSPDPAIQRENLHHLSVLQASPLSFVHVLGHVLPRDSSLTTPMAAASIALEVLRPGVRHAGRVRDHYPAAAPLPSSPSTSQALQCVRAVVADPVFPDIWRELWRYPQLLLPSLGVEEDERLPQLLALLRAVSRLLGCLLWVMVHTLLEAPTDGGTELLALPVEPGPPTLLDAYRIPLDECLRAIETRGGAESLLIYLYVCSTLANVAELCGEGIHATMLWRRVFGSRVHEVLSVFAPSASAIRARLWQSSGMEQHPPGQESVLLTIWQQALAALGHLVAVCPLCRPGSGTLISDEADALHSQYLSLYAGSQLLPLGMDLLRGAMVSPRGVNVQASALLDAAAQILVESLRSIEAALQVQRSTQLDDAVPRVLQLCGMWCTYCAEASRWSGHTGVPSGKRQRSVESSLDCDDVLEATLWVVLEQLVTLIAGLPESSAAWPTLLGFVVDVVGMDLGSIMVLRNSEVMSANREITADSSDTAVPGSVLEEGTVVQPPERLRQRRAALTALVQAVWAAHPAWAADHLVAGRLGAVALAAQGHTNVIFSPEELEGHLWVLNACLSAAAAHGYGASILDHGTAAPLVHQTVRWAVACLYGQGLEALVSGPGDGGHRHELGQLLLTVQMLHLIHVGIEIAVRAAPNGSAVAWLFPFDGGELPLVILGRLLEELVRGVEEMRHPGLRRECIGSIRRVVMCAIHPQDPSASLCSLSVHSSSSTDDTGVEDSIRREYWGAPLRPTLEALLQRLSHSTLATQALPVFAAVQMDVYRLVGLIASEMPHILHDEEHTHEERNDEATVPSAIVVALCARLSLEEGSLVHLPSSSAEAVMLALLHALSAVCEWVGDLAAAGGAARLSPDTVSHLASAVGALLDGPASTDLCSNVAVLTAAVDAWGSGVAGLFTMEKVPLTVGSGSASVPPPLAATLTAVALRVFQLLIRCQGGEDRSLPILETPPLRRACFSALYDALLAQLLGTRGLLTTGSINELFDGVCSCAVWELQYFFSEHGDQISGIVSGGTQMVADDGLFGITAEDPLRTEQMAVVSNAALCLALGVHRSLRMRSASPAGSLESEKAEWIYSALLGLLDAQARFSGVRTTTYLNMMNGCIAAGALLAARVAEGSHGLEKLCGGPMVFRLLPCSHSRAYDEERLLLALLHQCASHLSYWCPAPLRAPGGVAELLQVVYSVGALLSYRLSACMRWQQTWAEVGHCLLHRLADEGCLRPFFTAVSRLLFTLAPTHAAALHASWVPVARAVLEAARSECASMGAPVTSPALIRLMEVLLVIQRSFFCVQIPRDRAKRQWKTNFKYILIVFFVVVVELTPALHSFYLFSLLLFMIFFLFLFVVCVYGLRCAKKIIIVFYYWPSYYREVIPIGSFKILGAPRTSIARLVLSRYPRRLPPLNPGPDEDNSNLNVPHMRYHKCPCYGHTANGLPDYKLLAQPRTNNYYAAVGGCPCIPRAPAHPGSWRLKKAQMRSATHRCGNGCINRYPQSHSHTCCVHTGHQYGWRPGPHTVKAKNTAATGKCDTWGNLAFRSNNPAYLPAEDNVSDVSSVSPQKLADLEGLILEEHENRVRVEADVNQLKDIKDTNTANLYKGDREVERRRHNFADPSEEQLNELLRAVKDIVQRPLNQINMDLLVRIIRRQQLLQRKRDYDAAQLYNVEKIAEEYAKERTAKLHGRNLFNRVSEIILYTYRSLYARSSDERFLFVGEGVWGRCQVFTHQSKQSNTNPKKYRGRDSGERNVCEVFRSTIREIVAINFLLSCVHLSFPAVVSFVYHSPLNAARNRTKKGNLPVFGSFAAVTSFRVYVIKYRFCLIDAVWFLSFLSIYPSNIYRKRKHKYVTYLLPVFHFLGAITIHHFMQALEKMLQRTRFYNYFDVDDIAAKEAIVPVTFLVSAFALAPEVHVTHQQDEWISGEVPNSSAPSSTLSTDIREGQTALAPLWSALRLHRAGFVRVHTPIIFDLSVFLEFKTDALAPSLWRRSPYFYEIGLCVARSMGGYTSSGAMTAEGQRLVAQLIRLFQLRCFKVLRATQKTGLDQTELRDKLVEMERFLLDAGIYEKESFRSANYRMCYLKLCLIFSLLHNIFLSFQMFLFSSSFSPFFYSFIIDLFVPIYIYNIYLFIYLAITSPCYLVIFRSKDTMAQKGVAGDVAGDVDVASLSPPMKNSASVLRYPFRQMNMSWWGPFVKAITNDSYPNTPLRITFCLIAHAIIHEDPFMENAVSYITSKFTMNFTPEENYQFELYKTICRIADFPSLTDLSKRLSFMEEEEQRFMELAKPIFDMHEKQREVVGAAVEEVCQNFQCLRVDTDTKNNAFFNLMNSLKKLYLKISPGTGIDVPDGPIDTFVCCEGCPCYARLRSLPTIFLRDVEKAKIIDCIMMAAVKENDVPLRDAASELLYNHFHDFMENPYVDDISYFIQNGKLFFCRAALFDALSLIAYFTQSHETMRHHKDDVNRIVIPLLWVKNEIREIRGLHELVHFIDKALITAESSYQDVSRQDYPQAFHTIKDHIVVLFSELSSSKYHLAVHSRDVFTGKPIDMKCANPSCDGSTKDLLKCSGCDVTYYCSSQCQKADWDTHKNFCHDIESRRARPTPVEASFSNVMSIKPVI
eukprot:gene9668-6765_t